jgi:hypothetical protein
MLRNVGVQARGTDPVRLSQKVSNPLGTTAVLAGRYLEAGHGQTVSSTSDIGPGSEPATLGLWRATRMFRGLVAPRPTR